MMCVHGPWIIMLNVQERMSIIVVVAAGFAHQQSCIHWSKKYNDKRCGSLSTKVSGTVALKQAHMAAVARS